MATDARSFLIGAAEPWQPRPREVTSRPGPARWRAGGGAQRCSWRPSLRQRRDYLEEPGRLALTRGGRESRHGPRGARFRGFTRCGGCALSGLRAVMAPGPSARLRWPHGFVISPARKGRADGPDEGARRCRARTARPDPWRASGPRGVTAARLGAPRGRGPARAPSTLLPRFATRAARPAPPGVSRPPRRRRRRVPQSALLSRVLPPRPIPNQGARHESVPDLGTAAGGRTSGAPPHGGRARGARQGGTSRDSAREPRRLDAGRGARPSGDPREAGAQPGAGSRPDPIRPHAHLGLRLLPRRGGDHGR